MNVNITEYGICAPKGFTANGIYCGIRKNPTKPDLAMVYSQEKATGAGVYTTNKVKGAPLIVTKEHLADGFAQAIICNSGNANTCNADGEEKARIMAKACADALGILDTDVLVASTGVIGQPLNADAVVNSALPLAKSLSKEGGEVAARAIMTTDTVKKSLSVTVDIGGKTVTIGAMAKGSGMIHPNMATMLCFITTDAAISAKMLSQALTYVIQRTFNRVSIDGDTSTNDMALILANGMAENTAIEEEGLDFEVFQKALMVICGKLCRMVSTDGEGATKLLQCKVHGSPSEETAETLAKSVIMSPLVKSAFFGADANWGRILCALGYAKAPLTVEKVDVTLSSRAGEILVCENGAGVDFSEEKAKKILLEDEINIDVSLQDGDFEATAWGCDLTYDYVRINGDYRT